MKKLAVFAVFGFILGIGGLAWGHVGLTWYAAEITSATPIAIDGDLSDWAWIDEEVYVLTSDDLGETLGGDMPAKDDWDCAIYPGWSRSENMLYFGIHVIDDVFNNDTAEPLVGYNDDCVEILVDADHSGGPYLKPVNGVQAQQYLFHIMGPGVTEDNVFYNESGMEEQQWSTRPPWVVWAYDDTDQPNITYEWKMAIWDRHDPAGAGASDRHILAPDQILGFTIQIDEVDEEPETREAQPGTGGPEGGNAWQDADAFSDLVLVGGEVAVEPSSWGTIKSIFR